MRQRDPVGGHNERMKLLATSINAVGLAFVVVGIVRPLVNATITASPETLGYIFGALALHALAHYVVSQVEIDK